MRRTALLFVAFIGCGGGRATHAECTEMLDKYLDMTIAAESGTETLPPEEAASIRQTKKGLRKGDAAYRRAAEQCGTEITKREYRCAMKTFTPEAWQACID